MQLIGGPLDGTTFMVTNGLESLLVSDTATDRPGRSSLYIDQGDINSEPVRWRYRKMPGVEGKFFFDGRR